MTNITNKKGTYEIVTSDGVILDTCRSKNMANKIMNKQKKIQMRSDIVIKKQIVKKDNGRQKT